MPSKTMNPTLGDFLKREYSRDVCREAVVLASGNNCLIGTVLGRIMVDVTTLLTIGAAVGGNTGNGTVAVHATPVRAGARSGVYRVVYTAATTFNVIDPQGDVIAQGVNGALSATEVAFTMTAGGTAFVAGDSFTVTVPVGNLRVVPLAATVQADGSHRVAGCLIQDTDATLANTATVILARGPAVVSLPQIIWPAGLNTAPLRAPALAVLTDLGIVARNAA